MKNTVKNLSFENINKVLLAGVLSVAAFLSVLAFSYSEKASNEILNIGTIAPEQSLKMTDVSGSKVSLNTVAKKKGLLVIFNSNNCPFVVGNGSKSEGWDGRYPELYDLASQSDIGMVLVNSNEAHREKGESMDDMKAGYEKRGFKGYYALDDNHVLADAFGALTTPHVFLFDENMKLIYRGAIDDSVDSTKDVKEAYLKNAIQAHLSGNEIEPNSTRQLGCSIKRVKV
ncbi:redoxin family protein [Cryomorpha ignava]|uniref:Redoxin family protein n=1 Tax=Cryomorpha ignava TaxID=101383 RepID=A0A7K3WK47_9FLAO|nr:redoxin family protein [Cryomorpha ignava]NEN22006.1 redoxin family protein [Cryomorpha ignava]